MVLPLLQITTICRQSHPALHRSLGTLVSSLMGSPPALQQEGSSSIPDRLVAPPAQQQQQQHQHGCELPPPPPSLCGEPKNKVCLQSLERRATQPAPPAAYAVVLTCLLFGARSCRCTGEATGGRLTMPAGRSSLRTASKQLISCLGSGPRVWHLHSVNKLHGVLAAGGRVGNQLPPCMLRAHRLSCALCVQVLWPDGHASRVPGSQPGLHRAVHAGT